TTVSGSTSSSGGATIGFGGSSPVGGSTSSGSTSSGSTSSGSTSSGSTSSGSTSSGSTSSGSTSTGSTSGGSTSSGSASGGSTSTGSTSGGATSGGGGGGSGAGLTKIYLNAPGGNIYVYDSSDWNSEVRIAAHTGAFSISSGPAGNTLYLQISNFSAGPLETLDITTGAIAHVGGSVPGNALGEGRNGGLFAGDGV